MDNGSKMFALEETIKHLGLGSISVASVLRSYRLCENLSLKSFARILGISKRDLNNIEYRKCFVSLRRALGFADAMDYPRAAMARIWVEETLRGEGIEPSDVLGEIS